MNIDAWLASKGGNSEPQPPLSVELKDCLKVVPHYHAQFGPNVCRTTSDWTQIIAFLRRSPRAVVTVQYEILSSIDPVVILGGEGK